MRSAVWAGAVTCAVPLRWAWLSPASRMAMAARCGRIWSSRTYVFPGRPGSVPVALVYPWRHR